MVINWNESISRQIIISISGYEANKIFDQKVTTVILSVNETEKFYNVVTNPFYLATESETVFFNLLEISKNGNTNPTIAYVYEASVEAVVTLK